jgi:hypothetical protein
MTTEAYDLKAIGDHFQIFGQFDDGKPYGTGHINDTFQVFYDQSGTRVPYVFQRLNHTIFTNPVGLMDNVERVCKHLKAKLADQLQASRRSLEFHACVDTGTFLYHDEGNDTYWRVYSFVDKARTFDVIETTDQAYQAARAFGAFQSALVDLPGDRLVETIPFFHDTPKRFQALENAIAADICGRVASASDEIAFAMAHREICGKLLDLHAEGTLPERITHNDCKLNNVLIDDATGEGICVIDLDTIMPGFVLYDFGDMIRTSTSPAAEDETDLSKVTMQMPMFQALARGYLEAAGEFLTDVERDLLPFGGKLITFTIGLRFLTDYLAGDTYFKIHRDGHNLDRCRTQFKLVESIEAQEDDMNAFVRSL